MSMTFEEIFQKIDKYEKYFYLPNAKSSINMDIVKKGKLRRELIPKRIRKLF